MVDPTQLVRLKIFADMSAEQRQFVAGLVEQLTFESNQRIVVEGDWADCMYVLSSGKACVLKQPSASREMKTLAILDVGDFFGEISMIESGPRSATVEARDKCTVLKISKSSFDAMLQQRPDICALFLRAVTLVTANRLKKTNRKYVDGLVSASILRQKPSDG